MRFYSKETIVISEDDSNAPKDIRFKVEDLETTEILLVKDITSNTVTIPVSAVDFPLPMPQVTLGKFLYLRGTKPFALKLNGGAALAMAANKSHMLWCDITGVTISNASVTDPVRLTWAIGGD